jgi:hypothetical protein
MIFMKSNPHRRKRLAVRSSDRGFALIVTISLMVLLTIIAVGLLSLSAISIRTASAGSDMAKARANARLALVMAIGQLQKLSGPDQRVHAEADLDHEEAGARSRWTGVYRSWLDTEKDRPSPQFLGWMVSGKPSALSDESAAGGTPVAPEMVTLVADGSLGNAAGFGARVEAGLLQMGKRDGFAWWIGDENAKARIPGSKPRATDPVAMRAELMTAPQAGIQRVSGLENVSMTDEKLDRAITLASLDLVAGGGGGAAAGGGYGGVAGPHFHDLTADSMSLVTNVRRGGFRKDLCMELEKPARMRPKKALYSVGGKMGITLGELWDYYNLWRELDYPSRSVRHPDGGTIPAGSPMLEMTRSHTQSVKDPYYAYKRLTVMRNTWVASLMSRCETTPGCSKSHQLYLVLDPILTVWNPFDVPIRIDRRAFQGFKYWNMPYRMNLTVGSTRLQSKIKDIVGNAFIMKTFYGRVEPIVLRPGEVQVVSQGTKDRTEAGHGNMSTDLRLGWNFGSGFRFKIPKGNANAGDRIRCDLQPLSDGHMRVALVEFLHYQGDPQRNPYDTKGVWVGGLMVDRNLDLGDKPLQAPDAPKYFPRIGARDIGTFTVGSLENRKHPVMMLSLDMKTEIDPIGKGLFQGRFMLRHNPKLPAYDLQSFDSATMATFPMQISVKSLNSWKDPILDVGAKGLGYMGGDYTAQFGTRHVVTHSIPREPIYSLAAFQHAVANGDPLQYFADHRKIENSFLYPSICHAIGNSFAPSFLAPDKTEGRINQGPAADHSYLANKALWDDWFLSSIAPQTSRSCQDAGRSRDQRTAFAEFIGAGGAEPKPLPNSHMKPWVSDPDTAMEEIFRGSRPQPQAAERVGAHLLVEGGFNVNSTSVQAWKVLLSSLRKQDVATIEPDSPDKTRMEASKGVPAAGLLTAAGPAIPEKSLKDPKSPLQWRGFRDLSDDQIDELAEAIVVQVRKRGPFLSLADFVNRRLGYDRDMARFGALQAALDDDAVSINRDFLKGSRAVAVADAAKAKLAFPEAEAGAAAAGIPGYVKQADLLTSLGPLLTPRSDTFRIRAYGETRSKNGKKVVARAWCEAIVQRTPEYLDSTADEAWRTPDRLRSKANKLFGRRFVVTRFRWLQPDKV